MRNHKIRRLYLKEKVFPPKFRRLSFRELMQLYREYEIVVLIYIDPWWYLPAKLLYKVFWIPFIARIFAWIHFLLVKKSKSIVVVV